MVTVRPATHGDLEAITEIFNEAILKTTASFYLTERTVEDRREWFESHGKRHPVLVAEADGNVAGWAALSQWEVREAYDGTAETSFYVKEESRGQGIGRQLKTAIIEEARRLGFHTLIARAAGESDASIHLNESFGFEKVGTMKEVGRKFGRLIDVHIFQLMLHETGSDSGST